MLSLEKANGKSWLNKRQTPWYKQAKTTTWFTNKTEEEVVENYVFAPKKVIDAELERKHALLKLWNDFHALNYTNACAVVRDRKLVFKREPSDPEAWYKWYERAVALDDIDDDVPF